MDEPRLTGRVPRDRIARLAVPRPPPGVVEGLLELSGVTELVSDALDELGIEATLPAATLAPLVCGARAVGPALTVRNVALAVPAHELIERGHINRQADYEAHNLTLPGDVLVIEGHPAASNLGGMSASLGRRQGGAGAIVWGAIRDAAHIRSIGYPVWCRCVTPVTGKWRQETAEINGVVTLGGVNVACGDLVVADESGVAFVPRDRAAEVLALASRKSRADAARRALIERGVPIADFPVPDAAADLE